MKSLEYFGFHWPPIPWPPTPIEEWEALMAAHHIDPYLVWSDLTRFRQFRTAGLPLITQLSFLVELDAPYDRNNFPQMSVHDVYDQKLDGTRAGHFVTVRLMAQTDTNEAIRKLIETIGVVRVQLGFPVSAPPPSATVGPPNPPNDLDLPTGVSPAVTCAVLDDGCPFAHSQFRVGDVPQTRVMALWDQTPKVVATATDEPGRWTVPATLPYGVELTNAVLDPILRENKLGVEVDEDTCYAVAFGIRQHGMDTCRTHGTAVMDVMAGSFDPRSVDTPKEEPCRAVPIVFVQFPASEAQVSNGRWLAVNALDGLRYVLDAVARFRQGELPAYRRKIVANMSYGALAGPHDGTGMMVRAMDELCEIRGNLAVVLAAGNSQSAFSHARRAIPPGGKSACLHVIVPPDKSFETYLEIWFADTQDAANATVEITPPGGLRKKSVGRGHIVSWSAGTGDPDDPLIAAAIFPQTAVQGTVKTMMLVVLTGTQLSGRFVSAPAGEWTIDVLNNDPAREMNVEAWLERDDLRYSHQSQFAHFDDDHDEPRATGGYVTRDNTLTSVAGGQFSFTVGGYVDVDPVPSAVTNAVAAGPDKKAVVANYSGFGAIGVDMPPVYARADCGYAVQGVRVAGTRSGSTTRISGTSVAAPQLGRALLNVIGPKGNLSAQAIMGLLPELLARDPSLMTRASLEDPDSRQTDARLISFKSESL